MSKLHPSHKRPRGSLAEDYSHFSSSSQLDRFDLAGSDFFVPFISPNGASHRLEVCVNLSSVSGWDGREDCVPVIEFSDRSWLDEFPKSLDRVMEDHAGSVAHFPESELV